jgi:hypothetical protein
MEFGGSDPAGAARGGVMTDEAPATSVRTIVGRLARVALAAARATIATIAMVVITAAACHGGALGPRQHRRFGYQTAPMSERVADWAAALAVRRHDRYRAEVRRALAYAGTLVRGRPAKNERERYAGDYCYKESQHR